MVHIAYGVSSLIWDSFTIAARIRVRVRISRLNNTPKSFLVENQVV